MCAAVTFAWVSEIFGQDAYTVRFGWGLTGARRLATDVSVVVDVLSFSTSVTVAVERGMQVFPYRWNDAGARQFADDHDAVLAVGRLESQRSGSVAALSLSPYSLLTGEAVPRLVLPSPNGSTIAALLAEIGSAVVVGCLRNAGAVARWLAPEVEAGRSIALIAAGERWPDDSLRPALEDHLGAGAILAGLVESGCDDELSPEARVAADVFESSAVRLDERLHECVSGRELCKRGFSVDVDVAGSLDTSSTVPVLADGAFGPSTRQWQESRNV